MLPIEIEVENVQRGCKTDGFIRKWRLDYDTRLGESTKDHSEEDAAKDPWESAPDDQARILEQ